MDYLLEMKDVELKYGTKNILENINWTIKPGQNFAIFGLNGTGKTSLLSLAAGYLGASRGNVYLFGEKVSAENKIALRRQIGFASNSFFDRYYRYENILDIVLSGKFGTLGIQQGVVSTDVRRAKELLNLFGLKNKLRYTYNMLSQGQRQKVIIARALLAKPRLLILDEPCSGMDVVAKTLFLQRIEQLAKEQAMTLIYVSHHPEEFSDVFTDAVLIKNKTIFAQGALKEIFTDSMMTDFLGCPAKIAYWQGRIMLGIKGTEEKGAC